MCCEASFYLQGSLLEQIAALPLGSHLRVDPWTDEVFSLHFGSVQMVSARDKMPFQVTPIHYRLQQYVPPGLKSSASATPAAQ
ncbi:MAG: hypothetical protein WCC27_17170 [Acidobacteriaceae bacterium]